MRKLLSFIVLTAAVLLSACGGSGVKLSPEVKDMVKKAEKGFLGDAGGELVLFWAERSVSNAEMRAVEGNDGDKWDELYAASEQAMEQWEARVEELSEQLEGLEMETEVAEDAPLEIVEPFKVTRFTKGVVEVTATLRMTSDYQGCIMVALFDSDDNDLDLNAPYLSNPYFTNKKKKEQYEAGKQFSAKFLILLGDDMNPGEPDEFLDEYKQKVLFAKKARLYCEEE